MKSIFGMSLASVLLIVVMGCSGAAKIIQQKMLNDRTNVFIEIKDGQIPEPGFAVLVVKASIKTHKEGYYLLESKDSQCGKPIYSFLINIAGQTVLSNVQGREENLPRYDQNGEFSHDPSAGEGVRYSLQQKFKLRAGTYSVFLGLPNDNAFKEAEITIQNEKTYVLEFIPVYKNKIIPRPNLERIPSFMRGIKDFLVRLDET